MTLRLRTATPGKPLFERAHHTIGCVGKSRYPFEARAREVGQQQLQAGSARADRLFTYPCAACRGWHLTRRPNADGAITATALREDASL